MGPSIWQLLIVLVIVLLLFGTKRVRHLGSDLGTTIKGFRKAMNDDEEGRPGAAENLEETGGTTIDVEVETSEKDKP